MSHESLVGGLLCTLRMDGYTVRPYAFHFPIKLLLIACPRFFSKYSVSVISFLESHIVSILTSIIFNILIYVNSILFATVDLVNGWEQPRGCNDCAHAPVKLLAGTTSRTQFSAVRYNPVAVPGNKDAFSNGDGIFIYPGIAGPLSSLRLENFRDGLEDLELLRAVSRASRVGPDQMETLAKRVITGFTANVEVNATGDPAALEAARTAAIKLLSSPSHNRMMTAPTSLLKH